MNILQRGWYLYQLRHRFYNWSRERLALHQEERLARIMAYAAKNSPYYCRLLAGKTPVFADLPVITKKEMMEHFDDINTAGLRRDELVNYRIRQEREGKADLFLNRYSVGLSSGTSGNKLLTVLSPEERAAYGCLLFARNGIPAAIKPKKILFALRINNPAYMEVTRFGVTLVHVDYTKTPDEMIAIIRDKGLNILAGPPSLLVMLARKRDGIGHPVKALVSYAEVLEPAAKRELAEAFGSPVVEIYQGAEGFIGSTCRAGNLHLNEDLIFTEEVDTGDPGGKIASLLVTDLYRVTQPLLRYALEDLVEISAAPCPCGSSFRLIKRIHGRCDDVLHLKAADGTTRYLFPDYVCRSINQASPDILEFQACQQAPDGLEVRLVLKPGADREEIEAAARRNLLDWISKTGAEPLHIHFSRLPPQKNPRSQKMIRVVRGSQ